MAAAQAACREVSTGHWGRGTREAHRQHVAHVLDAGRVESQRLVERCCGLPSQKDGIRCVARCGPVDRRAAGDGGASSVQGRALYCRLEGRAREGAHVEHVAHVCDAGCVKTQRLVERPCVLPSRKEGIRCGARCGPADRRAVGDGGASSVQGWARLQIGGQGMGRSARRTRSACL